jgi:precorrin-6A/cobalt-precorrin-6A reductase
MKLLILGGTREAKQLVQKLTAINNLEIIYSIAGIVRQPQLDCEIISGGFTQYGGLTQYLLSKKITYLLDATHPFATKMSQQAIRSAAEANIPYVSFVRPEWKMQAGDDWSLLENEDQLLNELALAVNTASKNIFYTSGQIDRKLAIELDAIAELNEWHGPAKYFVRSAKETELPQYAHWIQAIGPFTFDDEKSLLEKYEVDLIVCKNSGGEATRAKLDVARELGIKVLMLQRPKMPIDFEKLIHRSPNKSYNRIDECIEFITRKIND